MKIYELIKCINATTTVSAKHSGSEIVFYGPGEHLYATDYFLSVPVDARVWDTIEFYPDNLDDVIPQDLARTMDFVQRLIDTPIKERYPEKKYRLRWLDGTYLGRCKDNTGHYYWTTFDKDGGETFTENELEKLKRENPHQELAIDAMEELMEDD